MSRPVADRSVVVDLAREVVSEVAPDELGLFPDRCRVYFRRWGGQGRDPLAMGVETWAPVVTFAILSTVQSVLVFIAVEFKKGIEEEGASTIRAWIKRGFSRLGPADAEPSDSAAVTTGTTGELTAGAADQAVPWTREQLAQIREHAYQQAITCKMAPDRAGLLADTIVARLVLRGSADE